MDTWDLKHGFDRQTMIFFASWHGVPVNAPCVTDQTDRGLKDIKDEFGRNIIDMSDEEEILYLQVLSLVEGWFPLPNINRPMGYLA